jgi:hypothetical protein
MLHTFPFLISNLNLALNIAYAVVVAELLAIAFIRFRFIARPSSARLFRSSSVATWSLRSAFGSAGSARGDSVAGARDLHTAIE